MREVFWGVIFPDSVSFFSEAEKLTVAKRVENEENPPTVDHCSLEPGLCIFLHAAFQQSHAGIHSGKTHLCQQQSSLFTVHENTNRKKQRASVLFAEILVCLRVQLSGVDRIEIRIGPQSRSVFCYKRFPASLFSQCTIFDLPL